MSSHYAKVWGGVLIMLAGAGLHFVFDDWKRAVAVVVAAVLISLGLDLVYQEEAE